MRAADTEDRLVQGWFSVEQPEPGVFVIEEPLHVERVKSFLVVGAERAVLVDTGMGVGDIRALVEGVTDRPLTVVNSHAHWDHVGGNVLFAGLAAVLIHEAEAEDLERGVDNDRLRAAFAPANLLGPLPAWFDPATAEIPPSRATARLHGGEVLDLGGRTLEVIHAPGHSPGGIVLWDRADGALFSTDVAYADELLCVGDDADFAAYQATMTHLAALEPAPRVCFPSHGLSPMDPALLPRIRDALGEIARGRLPEEIEDDAARHVFDGFSVLLGTGTGSA